ncbi:DUF2953 domain-containing protein [Bacillus sp. FSL K6-4563]|uniref:DUF2953 domain-containing protein n=1 Tax=Bacillus TaxID=1386 RepID=UPI000D03D030|nr:DUF2953 domain-containing protein [Bacillus pumilus]MCY7501018.1 DUF2953 domain-containing protein [Bacillus pumilus]MCY7526197.1 DUF2953 domain-containing protein [Bacillus pumilus]MDR6746957.1 hypothetical protein [Bacillus pumilus]MED4438719.1 DUF2953 domain-containing protein [Bacillus pumilus]MED4491111.1 DUF2953 domain-containing protein [Bacillus pumilus]
MKEVSTVLYVWIAAFLFLGILLIFMKVTISLDYSHANDDDHLALKIITLYGIIRLKKDIPMVRVNPEDQTIDIREKKMASAKTPSHEKESIHKKVGKRDMKQILHQMERITKEIVDLNRIMRKFFIRMRIVSFHWSTWIGFHDAALTGVAAGGVWSVKGALLAFMQEHLTFKHKPVYEVIPAFQHNVSQTQFTCIAYFRIGHAMLAAIRLLVHWLKGRKARKSASLQATKNESSV